MNKFKMLGLITLSILMTACATDKNLNAPKTPDMVKVDIKSYKIELSRNVLTKVKECNFFLLASNKVENKSACSLALQEQLTAYLNTPEKRKLDKKLKEYGEVETLGDVSIFTFNETVAPLSMTKKVNYVKEVNLKDNNVYEITPGTLETVDTYVITPYIIPNDQIVIKYILENGTIIKGDTQKKGALIRIEGNKIVNNGQQEILSIVNLKGSTFLIKALTATKEKFLSQ